MTWGGLSARYTQAEMETMRRLKRAGASDDELRFLHEAKARFDAELR